MTSAVIAPAAMIYLWSMVCCTTRLTELATAARQVASCGGAVELWATATVCIDNPPQPSMEQRFTTSSEITAWLNDINTLRQANGQATI